MFLGRNRVICPPGIGTEDGHPAQEEEDHNDDEHADHALLGYQVGSRTAAPDPVDSATTVGRQLLKLQLPWGPGLLQVTAITILVSATAATAQPLLWMGE